MKEKECNICHCKKSRSEFYRQSDKKDGLRGRCKLCDGESDRKWRRNNNYEPETNNLNKMRKDALNNLV